MSFFLDFVRSESCIDFTMMFFLFFFCQHFFGQHNYTNLYMIFPPKLGVWTELVLYLKRFSKFRIFFELRSKTENS